MPTTITLTTMPGARQRCGTCTTTTVSLCGPSLGREQITIQRTDQIAAAVKAFGERVRAEHPDASFRILLRVAKGQRKPRGYDAADGAGCFGQDAFMHIVEDRAEAIETVVRASSAAEGTP